MREQLTQEATQEVAAEMMLVLREDAEIATFDIDGNPTPAEAEMPAVEAEMPAAAAEAPAAEAEMPAAAAAPAAEGEQPAEGGEEKPATQ